MVNINKTMSKKEKKQFIKDMIAGGDPKLKKMEKPMTRKEREKIIDSQLAMLKRNPKLLSGLRKSQANFDAMFGKDK